MRWFDDGSFLSQVFTPVAAIEKHLEEKVKTGEWKKDFDARVVVPAMDGVAQPLLQA